MKKILKKPKKLLLLLAFLGGFGLFLANLQAGLTSVSAELMPLVVYENHLDFGLVFPGQIRDGYFRIFYSTEGGAGEVNYRIIQKRKPLPPTHPEYPNGGDPDLPGYYRDLCPYILKISQDEEGDIESNASVGPNDLMDIWQVKLEVPAILDYVAQNHTGGVVNSSGEYGCDISVDIAVPNTSICGYKFFDLDENGQKDGNDYGLSSWTINLQQFDGQVWQTINSELTAVNGYYCFEFLNPGTYRVEEVLKLNWANTTPLYQEITISELENLNINFGNYLPGPSRPECIDADQDGFFDFSSVFCPQGDDCNDSNPNINPAATEVCDGVDNDCDGSIDEGDVCNPPECSDSEQRACDTGLEGICADGTKTCGQTGYWGNCVQNTPAVTEFCDGLDNDCDGTVDEGGVCETECSPPGNTQACNTGAPGICSAGTQTCNQFGTWGICIQNQPPTTEVCDGLDNDCDNQVDEGGVCITPECSEGEARSCNTGLSGICSAGAQTCDESNNWGSCSQNIQPQTEVCDGQDNDCDGSVDEGEACGQGRECTFADTQACSTGLSGVCSAGTRTCDQSGNWGSCVQDNPSETEICDSLDNDCDGSVDEGGVCNNGGSSGGGGVGGGGGGAFLSIYIHNPSLTLSSDPVTITINWFTNKPANSRVVYDTISHPQPGAPPNYGYQWSTPTYDTSPKVTYHSVTITGLNPNTTYYFRPISAASPEVYGSELSFVTGFTTGEEGTGGEEEPVESVEPVEPIGETIPKEPVSKIPEEIPEEPTGSVAGVEYKEPNGQVLAAEGGEVEITAGTTTKETGKTNIFDHQKNVEAKPPTDCPVYIWPIFILNLIATFILANRGKKSTKSLIKKSWLIHLLVVITPLIIWYPQCWLITWLVITLILVIIYLIIIIATSAAKNQD